MVSAEKEQIEDAIKDMLQSALEFDTYRKSLIENYWPDRVYPDSDSYIFAYDLLESYLNRMREATKNILE